ncbi:MAG TPA: protein kinase [Polyangiaceae bacterium]|nr:protein kinase [Polyangiaceae bacterium]
MTKSSGQDTSWVAGTLILGGRYRVLRHLGEGGMGVVYAVEHTGLPLRYAIKVLRRRFAQRTDLAGRLRAEAQCLAHLASHPNVVRVVDTGAIEDGRVYLLMELLEGRTLREELFYHKAFAPLEACGLVRQLVSALGAAHRLGVIHRDVKPSNVFLTTGGAVKLLDFGVAKVLHEGLLGAARKPLTEPGSLMGTPRYMAPEYLLGGKATDGRVDLYSAGVVLWEMLTGRSAFPLRDDNDQERMKVVHAIVTQGVPPLEAVGFGALPAELRSVVRRATVSDPEHRYANADAFIADLDAVAARLNRLSGRTEVLASPDSERTVVMASPVAAEPRSAPGEETLADEGATDPDLPAPGAPGFAPGAAQTTMHAPATPAYPPPHVPSGASLLPSSTTPPRPVRPGGVSYQVVLGAIVFSVGFLGSAAFVWNWTHRPASPAEPSTSAQGLDPPAASPETAVAEASGAPAEGRTAAGANAPAPTRPEAATAAPTAPTAPTAPAPSEGAVKAPAPPSEGLPLLQAPPGAGAPPAAPSAPPKPAGGHEASGDAAPAAPAGEPNKGRGRGGAKPTEGANPSPFAPPKRKFRPGF